MKRRACLILFLLLCVSSLSATKFNFQRLNYSLTDFSQKVEDTINDALDSTLVAYTKVDESLTSSLIISINNLSYEKSKFVLDGSVNYNSKQLPLYIEFSEQDEKVLFETLYKLLFNTFKYDLSKLFEREYDYALNYSGSVNSFFNKNNKYRAGDLIYLTNFDGEKSLATVSSTFNEVATIDYLYNSSPLVNLEITKGPKNLLGLNFSYDFVKTISISGEYFYLKSLFSPFDLMYLGLSSSYFYDLDDNSQTFSIDLGMLIEVPLSILFKSTKVLNSASVYSKAKIGIIINSDFDLHSAFELGYKQYLSTNFKLALAYKRDSEYEASNNLLIAFEFMF